jgi:hypothetical protein
MHNYYVTTFEMRLSAIRCIDRVTNVKGLKKFQLSMNSVN